jgi:hypothetical protein
MKGIYCKRRRRKIGRRGSGDLKLIGAATAKRIHTTQP